ncbi:sure-like protein [Gloeophyllum trabeum ATCC 11539]|uniref:Sure-like protein n=1 Tax=Gloeophyllum trabeum (strain ATCC 11539 / FP-39264 / Madison 617) TaxID=670483 RepID=S7S0C6_GLOTA|nr:sure-like protein [Gloeophyllum trabeum ATCC 11539]EPQ60800.1 sure-like protein [Gloeophyllum trabeum ATCC 11539]
MFPVNDDGPPGRDSPYIYGFYRHLTDVLGWDVKVVLPSTQKSWIGKAYQIKDIIRGQYYYPQDPDGNGEISLSPRLLQDGEVAEWILLDGTPATCVNIALHNLYKGEIDLVISGPNYGRNTSSAFALSSGTIGAALSSSLSHIRSIAVSYGTVNRPTPTSYFDPAHRLAGRIISHLWDTWGKDEGGLRNGEVDLYNINIPMIEELLSENGLEIHWTTIWRNTYGRLFQAHSPDEAPALRRAGSSGGPDAPAGQDPEDVSASKEAAPSEVGKLVFKFKPDMQDLIFPSEDILPVGSDGWAMFKGHVSVTPLRASFAEPGFAVAAPGRDEAGVRIMKL